ncbi:THAP domain-containing protein 7 isoform X2 [Pagrus major]|uniref:THAP domain-containing protein 7 isoform X2 n=1 Tax=Pagrus major TaxID=143350 RepID=UPI003CC88336
MHFLQYLIHFQRNAKDQEHCGNKKTPLSVTVSGNFWKQQLSALLTETLVNFPPENSIPPHKENSHSGDLENTRHIDKCQPSEEPADHRSVVAAETNENTPASSQVLSGVEQISQQQHSPSPPLVSRPLSPSHYMRRLPPPPGFYLSKEHSYAQLCPLLWRRRYNQAIDCLEKAIRQLHAARRRENRLRSTVLRLRDKRLKQALLVSSGVCKNKGSWTPGGEDRRSKGGCREETETNAKSEDAGLFEDTFVDQMELEGSFLPDTNSWSEGEKGFCFYCGRGQVQDAGEVAHTVSKTGKDAQPTVHEDSLEIQGSVDISACSTAENANDIKIVRLKRPAGKSVETSDSDETNSKVLLHTQLQHVTPAGAPHTDTHEQSLHFLGSQCERETEAVGQKHHQDLQQLFWIQDITEGQVILVPVPAEDRLQSILKMEGVADGAQTILVSEVAHQGDMGHMTENSGGLSKGETACDGEHREQHSVISTTSVEMREDVREKLKEHLEGFHLQLSTEFLN